MLTRQKTLLICFALASFKAQAQNKNTFFLKNTGEYVSKLDSADFIRIVKDPNPGETLYRVFDFYPKGQEKMEATSSTVAPVSLEGTAISFYINGKRKRIAEYKKNQITGDESIYYPNGLLNLSRHYSPPDSLSADNKPVPRTILLMACNDSTGKVLATNGNGYYIAYNDDFSRVYEEGNIKNGKRDGDWKGYDDLYKIAFAENYIIGQLVSGTATNTGGIPVNYTSRFRLPTYKGGITGFSKFLSQTIRYPAVDRENYIQGTVQIKFTITKYGELADIKILKPVSVAINAEALRVLKLSAGFWETAIAFGRPVDHYLVIPISFHLQK